MTETLQELHGYYEDAKTQEFWYFDGNYPVERVLTNAMRVFVNGRWERVLLPEIDPKWLQGMD